MKILWSEDVRDKHKGALKYYGARVFLVSDFEKAKNEAQEQINELSEKSEKGIEKLKRVHHDDLIALHDYLCVKFREVVECFGREK